MMIFNATNEEQHVKAFGHHFTLKPKQIKNFSDHIGNFLAMDKAEFGLVSLPDDFEDPSFKESEEGKRILAEKTEAGVNNYVRRLRQIAYNAQVSLKMDLEKANIKADSRAFASDDEIAAMELLAKYQDKDEDKAAAKIERIKQLEKRIGKLDK